MGLYDKKLDGLNFRNKKKIVIAIIALVLLIVLIYMVATINWSTLFKKSNISSEFSKNPFNVNKDKDLKLKISVKNDSEKDAEDVIVTIFAIEDETFALNCKNSINENNRVVIPSMSKNTTKIIECDILFGPQITKENIFEGSYSFDIVYEINKEVYKKRTTLNIKK